VAGAVISLPFMGRAIAYGRSQSGDPKKTTKHAKTTKSPALSAPPLE